MRPENEFRLRSATHNCTDLDFVTADHVIESVVLKKLLRNIRSELAADAAFADTLAFRYLGVGPQQVAHDAALGRLPVPVDASDVIQRNAVLFAQASVHDLNRRQKNRRDNSVIAAVSAKALHFVANLSRVATQF